MAVATTRPYLAEAAGTIKMQFSPEMFWPTAALAGGAANSFKDEIKLVAELRKAVVAETVFCATRPPMT